MEYSKIINISLLALCFAFTSLHGETKGKIEVAPSYVHVDIIESKNTVKELDMAAIRAEGSYVFWKGAYIKSWGMYGKESDGELTTAGVSIGSCIPLCEKLLLSPSIGVTYTNLTTTFHLDFGEMGIYTLRESFKGWAPFLGLELVYCVCKDLRLSLSGQYAWSRSRTKIEDFLNVKSDAQGPAYAVQLEYDLSQCLSVNIAGAYNESYSKDKNGIRGRGAKIGLVRWF